jgi:HSP20 family protein
MTFLTRRNINRPVNPWALLEQVMAEPLLHTACEPTDARCSPLALDVTEDGEAVTVVANVPGFTREQIEIEIHEGILSINAKHEEEKEEKTAGYHRRERYSGSLSRRVTLPAPVVEANAKAELRDGVLTLRLPKSQQNAPRKISVN